MNELLEHETIGDIVATNYQAAAVFEQFGIDFCCGGRRSVADACRSAAVDPAVVVRALQAIAPPGEPGQPDIANWPLDRLVTHIVETHHAYVKASLPLIAGYLAKLQAVHGQRHPELAHIAEVFEGIGRDLLQHMMKEEYVLFPYLRELAAPGGTPPACPFGTVENPIRMMEREHQEAGDELRLLRELTDGYTPPADGCTTYGVCFAELERFERDLHRHVHLENNVLFPRAVAAEHVRRG